MEQFYAIDSAIPVQGAFGTGDADIWAEQLSLRNAATTALLHYGAGNGWLDGQPAMIERRIGSGTLDYLGALLGPSLMQKMIGRLVQQAGVTPVFGPLPAGVEACRIVGEGRSVFVLINHGTQDAALDLPDRTRIVLGDATRPPGQRRVTLPPQGILVLVRLRS